MSVPADDFNLVPCQLPPCKGDGIVLHTGEGAVIHEDGRVEIRRYAPFTRADVEALEDAAQWTWVFGKPKCDIFASLAERIAALLPSEAK